MNILNMPSEETNIRIAEALERVANTRVQEDYSTVVGSKYLMGGDKTAGFFGFVPSADFITGDALATAIGLSNGTSQESNIPWLKYMWKGRVCFTPLRTIRHTVTWDAIYNAGCVYGTGTVGTLPPKGRMGTQISANSADNSFNTSKGDFLSGVDSSDTVIAVGAVLASSGFPTAINNGNFTVVSITASKIVVSGVALVTETGLKTSKIYPKLSEVTQNKQVTIGGNVYRVRLMRGASNDPLDSYADADRDSIGDNNEWNSIILPLHERAKTQNWIYPAYVGITADFGVYLSDEDLRTHNVFGTGNYTWCQEVQDVTTYRRVLRGSSGASYSNSYPSWPVNPYYGFRPVLELL